MNGIFSFKTFFRFLRKNRLYTVINVVGLALSLMFVIIIAAYTAGELTTDAGVTKADRIYLLTNAGGTNKDLQSFYGTAYHIANRLEERYPEIEMICQLAFPSGRQPMRVGIGDKQFKADVMFADSTFFRMFDFDLLQGSAGNVLQGKTGVVISEAFAYKAFPGLDAVGQRIAMNDTLVFTVSGLMKNIVNSTIKPADIIIRIDNVGAFNSSMDRPGNYNNAGSALAFALASEGSDLRSLSDDMTAFCKEMFWFYSREIFTRATFTPYRDVYFSEVEKGGMLNSGDRGLVGILLAVGLLILGFAVTNYINLTTAQAGFRAREMAARRLLGSTRGELVVRLVFESTVLSFIAFAGGLLLALLGEGYASMLLEKAINIEGQVNMASIAGSVLLVGLVGISAGIIPAMIISRVKPVDIMKGSLRTRNKMLLGKIFITFQNVITIAMIAASLTMLLQLNHLVKAPLGYRTENIIDIPTASIEGKELMIRLRNELEALSCVKLTAFSAGTPFTLGNNNTILYKGRNISMQYLTGDSSFFKILGLEIVRDNGLERGKGIFLTEYSFEEFDIPADAPEIRFSDNWTDRIAGVVKSFRLRDITYPLQPTVILMRDMETDFDPWNLLVEVEGNAAEAYRTVRDTYERVVRMEFDGKFIDSQVAENFASLSRTSTIVSLFAGIAVLISLLGLIAMSTYYVRQRSREVAVRKVFGSCSREILRRLTGTFLLYVGIAFIVATPLIWHVMRIWLSAYEYRIGLSPIIFAGAGLFCFLASFIAVFWQSYLAAGANPVDSLKAE